MAQAAPYYQATMDEYYTLQVFRDTDSAVISEWDEADEAITAAEAEITAGASRVEVYAHHGESGTLIHVANA
jgi:hypothetical protein